MAGASFSMQLAMRPVGRLLLRRRLRCLTTVVGFILGRLLMASPGSGFALQPHSMPRLSGRTHCKLAPPAAQQSTSCRPESTTSEGGSAGDDTGTRLSWCRATVAALACTITLFVGGPEHLKMEVANAEVILKAEERQTVDLFQRNTPGVVFITNSEVYEVESAAETELLAVPTGSGSGWIYDTEGHLVTNYHVIENAEALTVKFVEGTEVSAKVVGADPGTDVAVLQVSLPARQRYLLQPLQRGESALLSVGQEVFAIGNPFGLDHTLTKGIVSGVGRTIMSVGGRPIQGVIQTDASINPGNSGGPLLNSQGQVIGMNTLIISPSGASAGVGFAIPIDTVSARVASILKYGYVKRPSLGLYLGQDGLAQRLSGHDGGLVAGLQRNSAGGKAGILPGDILTQIDTRPVKRINDIFAELDEHEPGETVNVKLLRPRSAAGEEGPDPSAYTELRLKVQLLEAVPEK